MLDALKRFFGYARFRDAQEEVVSRILAGHELFVVMPTGAGKSLCYQLPVMMRPGYGLVLSPLIALMKDQVDALNARGLPAAAINSTLNPAEQNQIMQRLQQGSLKFLYVAPERFRSMLFRQFLANCPPALTVVDEAHCISQWGHDFRPDYQRLWGDTPELASIQLCAFTATATPQVREDVKEQLRRPAMTDIVAGFRRPNLAFSVCTVHTPGEKMALLENIVREQKAGIIYTATRKEAETVARALKIRCYHAGLNDATRQQVQNEFMQAEHPVIAATNAFGMGIDRADVRFVVHYSVPGSLEAYYQEAGRAGRDGQPADCLLLYSGRDYKIQEFLLEANNPSPVLLNAVHRFLLNRGRDGRTVYWHPEEPALSASGSIFELQAAMRVLERHGILRRLYTPEMLLRLRLTGDPAALRQEHAGILTQRSIFVASLAAWLVRHDSFVGTLGDLQQLSGLRLDHVQNVLNFYQGKLLLCEPAAGWEAVQLSDSGRQEKLALDFKSLQKKRALDLGRLEDVVAYCRGRDCRQAAIISYFGEKVGDWTCGRCDHCDSTLSVLQREPTPDEIAAARIVLAAVAFVDGDFGRRRLIAMLVGAEDSSSDLNHHPHHGRLKESGRDKIGSLLQALEKAGYLSTTGGEYPCLELTTAGHQCLAGRKSLDFALLATPDESSRPTARKRGLRKSPRHR